MPQNLSRLLLATLAVAAMLLPARRAEAQLTSFTFTGFGSGSLGGTPFTNTAFSITLLGDLANKVSNVSVCDNEFAFGTHRLPVTGSFDLVGIGQGSYTSPLVVFSMSFTGGSVFSFGTCSGGGLVAIDPSGGFDPTPRAGMQHSFSDYFFEPGDQGGMPSTAGGLRLDQMQSLSLASTPASTVPEPSSVALMAAGLGALVAARRRRTA